jgi:hypothetical protein
MSEMDGGKLYMRSTGIGLWLGILQSREIKKFVQPRKMHNSFNAVEEDISSDQRSVLIRIRRTLVVIIRLLIVC